MKLQFNEENGTEFLTSTAGMSESYEDNDYVSETLPNIHQDKDTLPTTQEQLDISQAVNTQMGKFSSIKDKIDQDISTLRSDFKSSPKTPIDILKDLIHVGTVYDTFSAYGASWTMRALDQTDIQNAYDECDLSASMSGRMFAIKLAMVTYALEEVNGQHVYTWFPDIKLEDFKNNKQHYALAIRKALKRYLELQPSCVIDTLYDFYNKLDVKREEALSELKNS